MKILFFLLVFILFGTIFPGRAFSRERILFHKSPFGGATVHSRTPNISISSGGIIIKRSTVKVIVNKKNMTPCSLILPNCIIYQPDFELPLGKNVALISFEDSGGKSFVAKWSFYVRESKLIGSILHNASTPLMAGERIKVRMKGKSGGRAYFRIGDVVVRAPMKEISKGIYTGAYIVKNYDYAAEEPVVVYLKMPEGGSHKLAAKRPVTIFAQLFRVKILSPKNNERVPRKFEIIGRTQPNVEVMMSITISYKAMGNLLKASGPTTGGIKTMSNDRGYFKKEFGFPISVNNLKAVITVFARKKNSVKSMTDEVTVYLDKDKDRIRKNKIRNQKKK